MPYKRKTKKRRGGGLRLGIEDLLSGSKKLLDKVITLAGSKKKKENAVKASQRAEEGRLASIETAKVAQTATNQTAVQAGLNAQKRLAINPSKSRFSRFNPFSKTKKANLETAVEVPNGKEVPNAVQAVEVVKPVKKRFNFFSKKKTPVVNAVAHPLQANEIPVAKPIGGSHSKKKYHKFTRKLHSRRR